MDSGSCEEKNSSDLSLVIIEEDTMRRAMDMKDIKQVAYNSRPVDDRLGSMHVAQNRTREI